MTRRIECQVDDPRRYERRGVSEELWAVGYLLGEVIVRGGVRLVPRKEKVQAYRKLATVFTAAQDPVRLKSDFLVMQEQMLTDFAGLQEHLNALWVKVIADLEALLFTKQNPELLKKYDIQFAGV